MKKPVLGAQLVRAFFLTALLGSGTVAVHAAEETRNTAYVYDGDGQLLREITEPSDSRFCLVKGYSYNDYGHRTSVQQRNCNGSAIPGVGAEASAPVPTDPAVFVVGSTSQQFDYPSVAGAVERKVTTANASFTEGVEIIDSRFGVPSHVTDTNSRVTRYRYDGLGRKIMEQRPDGNGTRWTYQACGGGVTCDRVYKVEADAVVPAYVITSYPVRGANVGSGAGDKDGPHTKTYYDELDRELRVEREGWDGDGAARLIREDTTYDWRGRLDRKSRPYHPGGSIPWMFFRFDLMGRPVYQTEWGTNSQPLGYTTYSYSGLQTTRTAEVVAVGTTYSTQTAQTTVEIRNAVGQLVSVTDSNGSTQTRTCTPWGDLRVTVDPAGNTVRMEYDRRGRKIRTIDPDLGTWAYDYDALGRVVRQADTKGQVAQLEYDLLGRLKRRLEPDQDSRWFYDAQYFDGSACANAKGALCEAVTLLGTGAIDTSRRYAYDSLGRITRTTTRVGAPVSATTGEYHADVAYNGRGQVQTQTYPAPTGETRLSLAHTYTPLGFLKSVGNAATGLAYWTGTQYDAQGGLTQQTYGNNVATAQSFDHMGRLLTSAAGPGNAVQNDSYGYDYLGNLRNRAETRAGAVLTYEYDYDNLNRLKTEARSGGALTGTQTITWSYDAIGNITSRSDVGAYAYPPSGSVRPHAVASVVGTVNGVTNPAYIYDANGNITSSAGRTGTWKSFNLPATLTRGTNQLSWSYDSEHERLREDLTVNGVVTRTTLYVNPAAGAGLYYEEELSGDVLKRRHYISGGHGTVAVLTRRTGGADEVRYWHKDHLGSTQVVTNEAGGVVERMEFEPFGKRRGADNTTDAAGTLAGVSTDRGFTGHEMLDEVGLIHMNGRIYDPAIGRFVSPDPTIPDPSNLQSYNRYSYVRNNPLSLVDPSGFSDEGEVPQEPPDVPNLCPQCGGSGINGLANISLPTLSGGAGRLDGDNPANAADGVARCAGAGGCRFEPVIITGTRRGALQGAFDTVLRLIVPPDLNGYSDQELRDMLGWSAAARTEYSNRAAMDGRAISLGAVLLDFGKTNAKVTAFALAMGIVTPVAILGEGATGAEISAAVWGGPTVTLGGGTAAAAKGEAAFFRGAKAGESPSLLPKPGEFKVDSNTGFVKDTHGVSVFDNPLSVSSKGYVPHRVDQSSVPDSLRIIQRGSDPHHFEIVPKPGANLTPQQFTNACSSIVCVR